MNKNNTKAGATAPAVNTARRINGAARPNCRISFGAAAEYAETGRPMRGKNTGVPFGLTYDRRQADIPNTSTDGDRRREKYIDPRSKAERAAFRRESVRVSGIDRNQGFAPDEFCRSALAVLPKALSAVMPLRAAHRADLPDAVRELSAQLTCDRSDLSRPYWSSPRLVSAYLRYFLPWNFVRLHRLFRSIPLPAPSDDAVYIDLGCGPLSVPMALWITNKAWREARICLICVDTAPHPMALGEAVFRKLAELTGEEFRWSIRRERKPILRALELARRPLLVTAGNVLNEWQDRSTDEDDTLADRMGGVAQALARVLTPQSMALFVEPGTRLGGTLCANLRAAALEEGLMPLAPCTHTAECPLLGRRDRGWCHVHEPLSERAVPPWLISLADNARLPKQAISYSYMLLCRMTDDERIAYETTYAEESFCEDENSAPGLNVHRGAGGDISDVASKKAQTTEARLLSDAFLVPKCGLARYACSERGLLLIPDAVKSGAGEKVVCRLSEHPAEDAKSGALIAERNTALPNGASGALPHSEVVFEKRERRGYAGAERGLFRRSSSDGGRKNTDRSDGARRDAFHQGFRRRSGRDGGDTGAR